MLIYIAGPYTASTEDGVRANVERAAEIGAELVKKGHAVIIPHLLFYVEQLKGLDYEQAMSASFEYLRRCDAMFYIAPSPGTDRERDFAAEHGKRIYTNIEEIETEANMAGLVGRVWASMDSASRNQFAAENKTDLLTINSLLGLHGLGEFKRNVKLPA